MSGKRLSGSIASPLFLSPQNPGLKTDRMQLGSDGPKVSLVTREHPSHRVKREVSLLQSHTITKGPSAPSPASVDDETFLTAAQVRARFGGVSAMSIWRWLHDPKTGFPQPVKLNRRNYWRAGELRRWEAERLTKAAN